MIKLDWTLGLQFVNFVVLLGVMNVLLYRPLRKLLEGRRQTIDGSHGRAKDLEAQIQEKMASYQARLQEAKVKGNEEKAALRQAAAQDEAKILGAAHEEANTSLQTIKARVQAEKQDAAASLRTEVQGLATQVATRVLGRDL